MLGLITCFFNPTNSNKLRENYLSFRRSLNRPIVTVELAFRDHPFVVEDSIKIRGSENNIMWQKERLLNIALESLPPSIDRVAWLDADIIFENPFWFEETEKKLESFPVVQLFESAYEKGGDSSSPNTGVGFGKFKSVSDYLAPWPTEFPLTGLAWAARRDVLKSGFFDLGIIGSGDLYQINAWLNYWNSDFVLRMPPKLRKQFLLWGWEPAQQVQGTIGFISGRIEHLKHGPLKNREYYKRQQVLVADEFCPVEDLKIDKNGIYAWTQKGLRFRKQLESYFFNRQSDPC